MNRCKNSILFVSVIFLVALLAACERVYAPVGESRFVAILVLTPDGEPADSVVIQVREKSTGNVFDICHPLMDPCIPERPDRKGVYAIFADEFKDQIGRKVGILVEGKRDTLIFTEEYTIGRGRHVFKIAGPDTVYLQPVE